MRALIFSLLAVATAAECQEHLPVPGHLRAEAEPAVVALEPAADGMPLVRLPSLEFGLSVEPRCGPDSPILSVVVSVADTRLRLGPGDLDETGVLRTTLRLPRQQAGQLRADGFCGPGRQGSESRLEIRGAFTARLSLRCGDDERASITYATLPLDVALECRAEADGGEQEASARQSTLRF